MSRHPHLKLKIFLILKQAALSVLLFLGGDCNTFVLFSHGKLVIFSRVYQAFQTNFLFPVFDSNSATYIPSLIFVAKACAYLPRNLTRGESEQYIGNALHYEAVCSNLPVEAEPTTMP
jgi:hypothetical protein